MTGPAADNSAAPDESTHAALRRSEARLRALAEATTSAIWRIDASGDVLNATEARWPLLTDLPAEVLAAEWLAAVHPDDREPGNAIWRQAIAKGQPFSFEQRVRQCDGSYRHFAVRAVPVHDGTGAIQEWVGADVDVTERTLAEAALRESEQRLRQLADAMPQVVWVADAAGSVYYYNSRVTAFAGVHQSAAGTWDWQPMLHPDDLAPTLAAWEEAMRLQAPYAFEHRLGMNDGSFRWHLSRAIPVIGALGLVEAWYGAATDIHLIKVAEQEIERRRREFETLVEHAPDIIARFDREQRYLYVNPAIMRMTGRDIADFPGRTNAELDLPAAFVDLWRACCQEVLASGQERYFEFTFASPEGPRHYRTRLMPERSPAGEIETLLSVTYDVTDRVRAEADRLALLDALAHDLKNPLTAMTLQAQVIVRQLARKGMPSREDLESRISGFAGLAAHMTDLIDELEEHARVATGRGEELEWANVDLVALIEDCLDQARQSGATNAIILEASEPALTGVWDRSRLQRVLENIVANAVKYSPGGAPIVVRVGRQGDRAVIAVMDRGLGIPAADVDGVFEFRRRAGNVGNIAGSGVGLASARRIVERHGGAITVESIEGIGSTFTIVLPLGQPTP